MCFKSQIWINNDSQIFDFWHGDVLVWILISGTILHCLFVKIIGTVVFMFSWREEQLSQLVICSRAEFSLPAAICFVLACTYMTVSSAYNCVSTSGHTDGRSLIYSENRSGPSIDPCGTPVHKSRDADIWLPTLTLLTSNYTNFQLNMFYPMDY